MIPVTSMPRPPPMPRVALTMPIAVVMRSRGNVSRITPMASGIIADETPCSALPTTSTAREPEMAQTTDPMTSSTIAMRIIFFLPYMSPNRDSTGVATAPASSVAVNTQVTADTEVWNARMNSGSSGRASVCITETTSPAMASAVRTRAADCSLSGAAWSPRPVTVGATSAMRSPELGAGRRCRRYLLKLSKSMGANLTSMAAREPSAVGAVPVAGRAPATGQGPVHGRATPEGLGSGRPRIADAVPTDVIELERALSQIAYLITRHRQHDRTAVEAGVPVSRAAVPILRLLAASPSLRPGEIAARLEVEPPHIARQVHLLERAGYAESVPDPGDRRAHTVRLTPAGRDAIGRISQAGRQQMLKALASWSPQELQQLATLISRMADDFSAFAASEGIEVPRATSD